MSTTLVLLIVGVAFAYAAWEFRRDTKLLDAGAGAPPYPHVPVIDAGGARVIDLRHAPRAVVASSAGLAWGLEARRVLPPVTLCVWVVSDDVLDEWMQATDVVWVILASRMKDLRKQPSPPAIDALYVPEGRYDDEALAAVRGAGLMIAHDLSVLGTERTVTFAEMLELGSAAPSGPKRPDLGGSSVGMGFIGHDFVWTTSDFSFVDLRRASIAALDNLAVFDLVDELLLKAPTDRPLIWVLAPWMLEHWAERKDVVVARFAQSVAGFRGVEQQLAVDAPGGDPSFVSALHGVGVGSVDGLLSVRSTVGIFAVHPLDVLRDLQFLFAIPEPTASHEGS